MTSLTRLTLITIAMAIMAALAGDTTVMAQPSEEELLEQARAILEEVPLVDGHNDVPWQYRSRVKNHLAELDLAGDTTTLDPPMHTDLRRLEAGGLGGQFWSVFVPAELSGPESVRAVLEQIDVVYRLLDRYPDALELALTADDVERIHQAGKVASLLGIEGGHAIGDSLGVLRQLYRLGCRYMTLTHSLNIAWADSATDDPKVGGLSPFGKEVVREMNRLGMLVDLSHVSPAVMRQALDISAAPPIFSHSSARAITNHPRNVPDDVLRRLDETDGVVMVTFVPIFVSEDLMQYFVSLQAEKKRFEVLHTGDPEAAKKELDAWIAGHEQPKVTLSDVADHIDHVRDVAGIDHVGIGGDLDGISSTPEGLEGVDRYPYLFAELLRRGHSPEDLKKIAGLNLLRVLRKAEAVSRRLQGEQAPSDVLLEEVDQAQGSGE